MGTGPTGISAALGLLESQAVNEIHIFDPGDSWVTKSQFKDVQKIRAKGSSSDPYFQHPKSPPLSLQGCKMSPSNIPGGFSLIWGACWNNFQDAFFRPSITRFIETNHVPTLTLESVLSSNNVLRCLENRTRSQNLSYVYNTLAIRKSRCKSKGTCLTGCPEGAIWNSIQSMRYLVDRGVKYHSDSYIDYLILEDKQIHLKGVNQNLDDLVYSNYEKVFLAAGPIESFRILSKSHLIEGPRRLKQTRTFFFGGIALTRVLRFDKQSELDISLSPMSAKFQPRYGDSLILQFYCYSKNLGNAFSSNFLFKYTFQLLRALRRNIFFGISYVSPEVSNQLNISYCIESNNLSIKSQPIAIRRYLNIVSAWVEIAIKFLRSGILVFPLVPILSSSGKGNHFGGFLSEIDINEELQLRNAENVIVCDSSPLPLPHGSFTLSLCSRAFEAAANAITPK